MAETIITTMAWSTNTRIGDPGAVPAAKTANVELLTFAMAMRDVDAGDGTFTHKVDVIRPHLAALTGRDRVVTTNWKVTGSA